ncbi:MAG: hypothetical protein H6670_00920 [Anaerolineaceae bacterium]|nr:hypothetical protein [Anaerolineaceae bacterium]
MPYSIDWLIPDQVIFMRVFGVTTEDEIRASFESVNTMIESSEYPHVHLIDDTGDIEKPISPVKALEIAREIGIHERLGWSLITREKSVLVRMGTAFGSSLVKSKVKSLATLEDAIEFLKSVDGSLNWDQVNQTLVLPD